MFSKLLKSCDQYGAKVGLHFGQWINREKGMPQTFSTEIGGFISIIGQACFWSTFIIYSIQMF